ncbi:SDR family NAD(P)-dependent oxidoreductase [Scytonema sp. NUACC26]
MSLELHLSGKTAIVTGGSAGIGLAIAKALYSEGVNVTIAARNPQND